MFVPCSTLFYYKHVQGERDHQQLLTYIIFYRGSCKHDKLYMNGADISSLLYINFNTFKIKLEKKDSLPATLLYQQQVG